MAKLDHENMTIENKIHLNEKLHHLEELREQARRIAESEISEEDEQEEFESSYVTGEGVEQEEEIPRRHWRVHQEEFNQDEVDQDDFNDLDTFTQEETRRE